MFGVYEEKFACMRAFLAYMITQPGKKMTFMGCEYAPFREWDWENQLEWFMLDYDAHRKMQSFTRALNHLYLERRELWEDDFSWGGFEWIWADNKEDNLVAYTRKGRSGESLICVLNFSNAPRENYPIPVPEDAEAYKEVFATDDVAFGGEGRLNSGLLRPAPDFALDGKRTLRINIPPLSAVILEPKKLPGRKKG
jgi:1,4-alpha-glucan branching enzyme